MVPAKEWEFWMSDENAAKAQSNDMMKNYFANVKKIYAGIESKVTKYEWGKEVAPGITAIATPGHTPGHTSFAVASGSSKILIQSDVTNIPEFFLRKSGLARCLRRRWRHGADDPSQILRHGGGREGDRGRLPLHLLLDRPCREGRQRLSADPGRLESGDLS
jgi:glyoxylase-like metal-dependent hydrolase (beta-lactamase superfamily II)